MLPTATYKLQARQADETSACNLRCPAMKHFFSLCVAFGSRSVFLCETCFLVCILSASLFSCAMGLGSVEAVHEGRTEELVCSRRAGKRYIEKARNQDAKNKRFKERKSHRKKKAEERKIRRKKQSKKVREKESSCTGAVMVVKVCGSSCDAHAR